MGDTQNIRIVDIAKMAGVSIGTVDRVLHNRGRVSEENRKKIEAILTQVNYKPNMMARSLVSKRIYHLAVIIPQFVTGEYWAQISSGIDHALTDFRQYHIEAEKFYFDQFDEYSLRKLLDNINLDKVDGVLVAPLFAAAVLDFSKVLDDRNIPYVFIDTDVEQGKRMAFIGTSAIAGGRIVAKLLSKNIKINDDILMARIAHSGVESAQAQSRRHGFLEYLKEYEFQGNTYEVDLYLKDAKQNKQIMDDILSLHKNIKAIVIFNSKAYIPGNYLEEKGRKDICLVGYDLVEQNERLLQNGTIEALLAQHPYLQGYEGIRLLYNKLIFEKDPGEIIGFPLEILVKENYIFYKTYKF